MPSIKLEKGTFNILDLLVKASLVPSKAEAKRNVIQGGIMIKDEKITDIDYEVKLDQELIIKKGKKTFLKVIVK